MAINSSSKHYDAYYKHVSGGEKAMGSIAKVYDIIEDISDRRGLRQQWETIDGDIQDEIIEKWNKIIDTNDIHEIIKIHTDKLNILKENRAKSDIYKWSDADIQECDSMVRILVDILSDLNKSIKEKL